MTTTRWIGIAAALLVACGGTSTAVRDEAPARAAGSGIEGADEVLAAHQVDDAVFVIRAADGSIRVHGREPEARVEPASTFKIPNTLIGLETGVIPDASFSLPWDGTHHEIEAWNRDHDLRSALEESAVWWYQEVARRVGMERMREQVAALRFGDAVVEDPIDAFWLDGGSLRISPLEQTEFLARLTAGELQVSARTLEILREVMPRRTIGDAVVLGKTGTASGHSWLVGWVEREGRPTATYALLVRGPTPSRETRWEIVGELLERAGEITGR